MKNNSYIQKISCSFHEQDIPSDSLHLLVESRAASDHRLHNIIWFTPIPQSLVITCLSINLKSYTTKGRVLSHTLHYTILSLD